MGQTALQGNGPAIMVFVAGRVSCGLGELRIGLITWTTQLGRRSVTLNWARDGLVRLHTLTFVRPARACLSLLDKHGQVARNGLGGISSAAFFYPSSRMWLQSADSALGLHRGATDQCHLQSWDQTPRGRLAGQTTAPVRACVCWLQVIPAGACFYSPGKLGAGSHI